MAFFVFLKLEISFYANSPYTHMKTTILKLAQLINSLTGIKKESAELFFQGFTYEQVLNKISKARNNPVGTKGFKTMKSYVTMGLDKIKLIDYNYFDGKQYTAKAALVGSKAANAKGYENELKDYARSQVNVEVRYMAKSGLTSGKILTLSSENPVLEKLIMSENSKVKYKFQSCEREADKYEQLRHNIKAEGLKYMLDPIHGLIGNEIKKAKRNEYAALFLDYCEHLNSTSLDIAEAVKKDIVQKRGIIMLTFALRTGQRKCEQADSQITKIHNFINSIKTDKYDTPYLPHKGYGGGCKGGQAPMYTLIIRRIK